MMAFVGFISCSDDGDPVGYKTVSPELAGKGESPYVSAHICPDGNAHDKRKIKGGCKVIQIFHSQQKVRFLIADSIRGDTIVFLQILLGSF